MRPTGNERSARGFTLIEVIGALVVFSAGVLVATALSQSLSEQVRDAAMKSEATSVGRATLDSLRAEPYSGFTDGETVENTVTIGGVVYTRSWTVTQVELRVLEVEVEVEGPSASGTSFSGAVYLLEEW